MIKILSSYKLIKNKQVREKAEEKNLSDIDYKLSPNSSVLNTEDEPALEVDLDEKDRDYEEVDERTRIEREVIAGIEEKRARIIENAEKEAEAIKKAAEERGLEEGRRKGIQEGYSEGIERAREETKLMKENALDLIRQSETYVEDYMRENEKNIIKLALDMAESIIDLEMTKNEDGILNLIRPVVREYNKTDKIIITCNASNYDYLKESLDELETITSSDTQFLIFKDNNLGDYDCVVETDNQFIDLSIRKQLESIFNRIKHME